MRCNEAITRRNVVGFNVVGVVVTVVVTVVVWLVVCVVESQR